MRVFAEEQLKGVDGKLEGVLFMKGEKGTTEAFQKLLGPFEYLGARITAGGAVEFFVSKGAGTEAVVTSPQALSRGSWNTIVCAMVGTDISLYQNGDKVATTPLEASLFEATGAVSSRTVSKMYESAHDYPNDSRETTTIEFSGARKLTITFAPECKACGAGAGGGGGVNNRCVVTALCVRACNIFADGGELRLLAVFPRRGEDPGGGAQVYGWPRRHDAGVPWPERTGAAGD